MIVVVAIFATTTTGCASSFRTARDEVPTELTSGNHVCFGMPNKRLDHAEKVLMSPRNWIRKQRDEDFEPRPYIREELPDNAIGYIESEEISGLNIDIDLYEPRLQWQRLKDAKHVGPLLKYTLGMLAHFRDVVLPARVFNQDRYNHFTKTLSLNSHSEASALYEAAMANEHVSAKSVFAATVVQRLPLGTTIARIRAGKEALDYSSAIKDPELKSELYPVVYRSVVSEALGDIGVFTSVSVNFPQRMVARVAASQIGKAVGKWHQKDRK